MDGFTESSCVLRLQRDCNGRIFLDLNPKCFQSIVDYLNELTISSEDNPPAFPCVDDEHKHILQLHLELFGLMGQKSMVFPDSNIVKDDEYSLSSRRSLFL